MTDEGTPDVYDAPLRDLAPVPWVIRRLIGTGRTEAERFSDFQRVMGR